jgi:hypothetical protein
VLVRLGAIVRRPYRRRRCTRNSTLPEKIGDRREPLGSAVGLRLHGREREGVVRPSGRGGPRAG